MSTALLELCDVNDVFEFSLVLDVFDGQSGVRQIFSLQGATINYRKEEKNFCQLVTQLYLIEIIEKDLLFVIDVLIHRLSQDNNGVEGGTLPVYTSWTSCMRRSIRVVITSSGYGVKGVSGKHWLLSFLQKHWWITVFDRHLLQWQVLQLLAIWIFSRNFQTEWIGKPTNSEQNFYIIVKRWYTWKNLITITSMRKWVQKIQYRKGKERIIEMMIVVVILETN